jgi:23S rRNA-/tRNA-specific pseudouridylate synthase
MVGMSPSSAHRLRRRLAGTAFDRDWGTALALHAQAIFFEHPSSGESMEISTPLPQEFQACL